MSYTAPDSDAVTFDLESAPPTESDAVAFDLAVATPEDLTADVVDTGSGAAVDLAWTNRSLDEDEGTRVYRSDVGNPAWPGDYTQIAEVGPGVETYQDDTVAFETGYTYRVTAVSAGGGESEPSNEASASIGQGPTFEVQITTTNSPVEAGETLTVDVDVVNVGDFAGEKDVTLSVEEQ